MPNFESPADLHWEAFALYRESKYSAAALTWAKSREAANTLRDRAAAFKAEVWEVVAWTESRNFRHALGLLLRALADVPSNAPPYIKWIAQTSHFNIQLGIRPELAKLQKILGTLETLATSQPHPAQDLHHVRATLAQARGEWDKSLRHLARGWQAFGKSDDGPGTVKSAFASEALGCALNLRRRQEAENWRRHLALTNQERWECARKSFERSTILLALEAGNPSAELACEDNGRAEDHYKLRGQLFQRGPSLDDLHDPSDLSHPARKYAAVKRKQDVQERYDALLALVDYRLACLRFTARLPALDDLYYRKPDQLPTRLKVGDCAKFERQLRSFCLTWYLLRRHAQRIDELLNCDWRTKWAAERWLRAKAIAEAAGSSLSL